jgi:RNA recognition motif-containing protein
MNELCVLLVILCISERSSLHEHVVTCLICRVTIMKDKVTRKSKGVAFVLFLKREDAQTCAKAINGREVGTKLHSQLKPLLKKSDTFLKLFNLLIFDC